MTIRMLQAWNGLHQQKIVTTLSGSDEAALVAAGIATYDLDGPAENLRMAKLATDAGGNVILKPKRRHVLTRINKGKVVAGSTFASSSAHTFNHIMELDASFSAVRISIPNLETTTVGGVTACVAVTGNTTSAINPTVGTGLTNNMTTGWVQVTFSGSNSVTLPARLAANVPSITWSDWIPLRSLPRSDLGTNPLLMVRICHPNPTATFTYNGVSNASWDFSAFGGNASYYRVTRQAIDGVATPASFNSTTFTSSSALFGVQARVSRPATTILFTGDSLTEGWPGPTLEANSWARKVCDLLKSAQYPVQYANTGWSGATTTDFYTRGISRLSEIKPEMAYMSVWSPNDAAGVTTDLVNKMIARAMDFVYQCELIDCVPILSTCCPTDGSGAGAYMLAVDSFVNDLASAGRVLKFDWRSVLDSSPTTGGGAGLYIPAYKYDNTHPNDAGHDAMAAHAYQVLSQAINQIA